MKNEGKNGKRKDGDCGMNLGVRNNEDKWKKIRGY